MEKKFKQKGVASFGGVTIANTGVVTLKFTFRYDEIVTSVQLLQGLNTDITIHAKTPDSKPMNLGVFTIGGITFNKDGNATIPFKSMVENVNVESICELSGHEYVHLKFLAVLELPDNSVEELEDKGGADEWED